MLQTQLLKYSCLKHWWKSSRTRSFILLAGSEGEGLSKRLGSLNLGELKQEGFESITLSSLLAKIGTSDPMKVFINTDELIRL